METRLADPASELAAVALDNLLKAVAIVGEGGTLLYRNGRFAEMFGGGWATSLGVALRAEPGINLGSAAQVIELGGIPVRIRTARLPQGTLVTADDISKLVADQAQAEELARTDPLTGLGNRLHFEALAKKAITQAAEGKGEAALLAIDLDHFKQINDSLGHQVGDAMLRLISDRIRSLAGPGDGVARLGGDEFGVLQIGVSQPDGAVVLAQQIIALLSRTYAVDGHLLHIGSSIGIACVPQDGDDYDEVMRKADVALYRAKQEGRRSLRLFTPCMDEAREARRCMEVQLRRALAMREFELVYQPQINLASGRTTGFEALLRWNNPVCGQVSPSAFIPLAEELGLIVPIGAFVIRTACREAAKWPVPVKLAVNVSATQLDAEELPLTVLAALAESGLDPRRLELEITETALLDDVRDARATLHRLRELGVQIAMDDFGTGYSSLSSFMSFPFEKLKIDQSFVRAQRDDAGARAIVRSVAFLANSLGMSTTAEGVETEEQMAFVRAAGCTDAQGYLLSKPLPAPEAERFLQRNEASYSKQEVA